MKIIWLDINSSYSHSNLGFASLHAQISAEVDAMVEWEKVSGTINSRPEQVVSEVLAQEPDFIFATAWLFNHEFLLGILNDIKILLPKANILLGGPEFLGTPKENEAYLRKTKFINYIFRGDGEQEFEGLLKFFLFKDSLVKGLCYLSNDDYVDGGCGGVRDFGALKSPEESRFFDWSKPFVQLETSRGCFNSCVFCVSGIEARVQNLEIQKLSDRLDRMVEKGIKEIRVLDRTFNANFKHALSLLELFSKYAGRLKFHLEVHPAFLDDRFCDYLKSLPVGLIHVEAGIQSLNDVVLSKCRRLGGSEAALSGIRKLRDIGGFEIHADLIIGLPEYTYSALVADTLRLISMEVDEVQIETLKCLYGTYARNNAAELGLSHSLTPPYQVLRTDWMTYEELDHAMTLSKVMDYWYNNADWRAVFAGIIMRNLNFIENFIKYNHTKGLRSTILSKESKGLLLYEFCEKYYPEELPEVSIAWAMNGLSMKKKPGLPFLLWRKSEAISTPSVMENPLYDPAYPTLSYYYYPLSDSTFWISIDRSAQLNIKSLRYLHRF